MTSKQKHSLYRIIAAAVLFIAAVLIKAEGALRLIIFMIPYLTVGFPVLKKAVINISALSVILPMVRYLTKTFLCA